MEKVKLVNVGEINFQKAISLLKQNPKALECGAILCFIGIVRKRGYNGEKVKKLYYEVDEKNTLKFMEDLRKRVLERNKNVAEIVIHHVVGEAEPGEETVCIAAIGKHSKDVFDVVMETLKEVKTSIPIWKKEITEKHDYWVKGERGK